MNNAVTSLSEHARQLYRTYRFDMDKLRRPRIRRLSAYEYCCFSTVGRTFIRHYGVSPEEAWVRWATQAISEQRALQPHDRDYTRRQLAALGLR